MIITILIIIIFNDKTIYNWLWFVMITKYNKTGNKLLGAILPTLFVITLVCLYVKGVLPLNIWGTVILGIIGLLFLFAQWDNANKGKETS